MGPEVTLDRTALTPWGGGLATREVIQPDGDIEMTQNPFVESGTSPPDPRVARLLPGGKPPPFLTVGEVATLLRTSRKAIYAMVERGQVPGVIRVGRRLLFRRDVLVDWLDQKSAPSPKESRR